MQHNNNNDDGDNDHDDDDEDDDENDDDDEFRWLSNRVVLLIMLCDSMSINKAAHSLMSFNK